MAPPETVGVGHEELGHEEGQRAARSESREPKVTSSVELSSATVAVLRSLNRSALNAVESRDIPAALESLRILAGLLRHLDEQDGLGHGRPQKLEKEIEVSPR